MFIRVLKLAILNYFAFKTNSIAIYENIAKFEEKSDRKSHLNYKHIQNICSKSVAICKSNDTNVCTTRMNNGNMEYRDYENPCFLFINNMCENYGREFSIISAESCFNYFRSRRSDVNKDNSTLITLLTNVTKLIPKITSKKATVKPILRSKTYSSLYEIDTAFDFHICPLSCPDVYNPVCIGVNRGHGLYYKFYTFVNHCAGDLYYCKHWREFSPPPDEEEMVKSSPLSWSYCAANRYIQFARFTEMTSSMGHYGWLAGDYKPTHIVEPRERLTGYG